MPYMSCTFAPFDIIHCDTSPVPSTSGYRYYLVLLDDFTHFVWVYPLMYKSEIYIKFLRFCALINTQFERDIKTFQCDMGVNSTILLSSHFAKLMAWM